MRENGQQSNPAELADWVGFEDFGDGSRLERSCYSDLKTRTLVFGSTYHAPDGSLVRGRAFTDQRGHQIITAEHILPDGSPDFESKIAIDPQTGIPVVEPGESRPDESLQKHARLLGRLALGSGVSKRREAASGHR